MNSIRIPKIFALVVIAIAIFSTNAFSQSGDVVYASDIMKDLKLGRDIIYKNVTVVGKLDFTYMDEKAPDLPKLRIWQWNNDSNVVKEVIESEVSFVNVTFEKDVIAYYHEEDSGYTFTADFENNVNFQNCKFNGGAMFKYSEFDGDASFENATFLDTTTFKYAKFESKANFEGSIFEKDATFKYASFRNGVSFNGANFVSSLDLKYTSVRGDFETESMYVGDSVQTKYTDINGRSFSISVTE